MLAARPDPLLGTVLCGTYRIERLLGRGGMGSVYVATHLHLRAACAVKVLSRELSGEGVPLKRFEREAQITSQLGHPNIVRVTDFNFAPDGAPFMVMELLEGETLHERLRRGPLSLAEAVRLFGPLCDALGMAHERGVIHRDLKPENLFLPRDLGLDGAKILDFGVSKIRDRQTRLTRADVAMGTQSYLAPELVRGDCAEADARSDVFSLGAILFEVLTARQAYDGPNAMAVLHKLVYGAPPSARALRGEIPEAVDAVILRALCPDPAARIESAPALHQELLKAALPYLPPAEEMEAQISTPYRYTSNAARALRQSASMPVITARELASVVVAAPASGSQATVKMTAPRPVAEHLAPVRPVAAGEHLGVAPVERGVAPVERGVAPVERGVAPAEREAVAPVAVAKVSAAPPPLGFVASRPPEAPLPAPPRRLPEVPLAVPPTLDLLPGPPPPRRGAPLALIIAGLAIATTAGLLLWRQRMLRELTPPAPRPAAQRAAPPAPRPELSPRSAPEPGTRALAPAPPALEPEPIPFSAEPPPSFADSNAEREERRRRHRHRSRLPRVELPTVDE